MTTTTKNVEIAIETLNKAYETKQPVAQLTKNIADFSIDDAYAVQLEMIATAVKEGATISGKKIGLTSLAMQQLLGVDEPDYGHLLDAMAVEEGGDIALSSLFQPKVEGEIAFVLKEDLVGPAITAQQVLAATDYVVPALEIVDSRIENWTIQLADTVADNASCGLYVLGQTKLDPAKTDLTKIQMELVHNGVVVNTGTGADVLGHPATCVAWLANKLAAYGVTLKRGEVILSGALSAAVVAKAGDEFIARFTELGDVSVTFR